jgi:hypothetical protein
MQKLWTVAFMGALMAATGAVPARASELHSGTSLCIKPVAGVDSLDGYEIVQVPCDPYDPSMFWTPKYVRDFDGAHWFMLRNEGAREGGFERCLDLTDGVTADWQPLQLWTCNPRSTTMLWTYDPNGDTRFINARSRKCMDVRSGSFETGAVIQNYHCANLPDGSPNYAQIWNWGPH